MTFIIMLKAGSILVSESEKDTPMERLYGFLSRSRVVFPYF